MTALTHPKRTITRTSNYKELHRAFRESRNGLIKEENLIKLFKFIYHKQLTLLNIVDKQVVGA